MEARLTSNHWHFMGVLWIGLFAFPLGWSRCNRPQVHVLSFVHAARPIGGIEGTHWLSGLTQKLEDGKEQPLRRHPMEARRTHSYLHFIGVLGISLFAFLPGWN